MKEYHFIVWSVNEISDERRLEVQIELEKMVSPFTEDDEIRPISESWMEEGDYYSG